MRLILDKNKLDEMINDRWLMAMALTLFEDFVRATSAEEFARRFGTVGTETINKYFIQGDKR